MTKETFLQKFNETAKHFQIRWKLHYTAPYDKLRIRIGGNLYCPITAVYMLETGKFEKMSIAYRVGTDDLKLSPELTYAIIEAADSPDLDFFGMIECEKFENEN